MIFFFKRGVSSYLLGLQLPLLPQKKKNVTATDRNASAMIITILHWLTKKPAVLFISVHLMWRVG